MLGCSGPGVEFGVAGFAVWGVWSEEAHTLIRAPEEQT